MAMPHFPFYYHSTATYRGALNILFRNPGSFTASQLTQLHSLLIVSGAITDPIYATKLTAHFAIVDHSRAAILLRRFNLTPHISLPIWNTLIRSPCDNHRPHNVVSLTKDMVSSGCLPDNYTFSFVFRACAQISNLLLALMFHGVGMKLGWSGYDYVVNGLIHCYICCDSMDSAQKVFDESPVRDVFTWTAVINGYWKIGRPELAEVFFDEMPERNAVSWSTMINGYAQMGMFVEALETFSDMLIAGIQPNQSSLVGALSACAHLGALDQGRWIHAYIVRSTAVKFDGMLGTALVDMYAKCGCIDIARDLFEKIPHREMYPSAYTSLIAGLANHGDSTAAFELFTRMEEDGVRPSEVTFISVLSACSRIGLVQEGLRIFGKMKDVYGIEPRPQHYGCLVDLLGRAGLLEQAGEVVRRMPVEPGLPALGALLNACRVYGDIKLGKTLLDEISKRCLDHSGVHVLLSNIYASVEKWNDVEKVRAGMVEKKVRKVVGRSWIEIEGMVIEFGAGDKFVMEMKGMDETVAALLRMEGHLKSLPVYA